MGGLLSRNYILQNPGRANHYVKTLVTIGSPWLGAPRAIHAIETGSFIGAAFNDGPGHKLKAAFSDFIFSNQIKQIIEGFPGAHQLLPSKGYFDLGGNPLNVDGTNYSFLQTQSWINLKHPNYNPGNQMDPVTDFHTPQQDDFRNDTTGVNYYHIYGKQASNKTVGRVEARTRAINNGIGNTVVYEEFVPFATAGDGTVPISVLVVERIHRTD